MRTNSPRENIPDLDNLYNTVVEYVKEHQGDRGYLCTDDNCADTIYGTQYSDFEGVGVEKIVFGVKVKDNELFVLLRPFMRTYHNSPTIEEFLDDNNWQSVKYSDVYYIPTLFNIAEYIEEYGDEEVQLDCGLSYTNTIDGIEDVLTQFGEVRLVDEKIDDGLDDCEDKYLMLRCYDLKTENAKYYIRLYYGDVTREITTYEYRKEN